MQRRNLGERRQPLVNELLEPSQQVKRQSKR
jgi:hypothetical protein